MVDFSEQWKVLIYDIDGRDIISPLLNVGALRQKGVTLHLLLHSEREAVPDAPAVYFIRPTEANLKRVAEDCQKQLYRSIHLNFITRIERPVLEKFAQDLVAGSSKENNSAALVSKLYDQYLDCIALESSLFTLNIKDAFLSYNEASANEQQIRGFMNRVAMGLLSTVRVLGTLPVIRAPPGGAAEMLASELHGILKENISSRGPAQALFEDCLVHDKARPLLLIVERSSDMFPVFQHNSTYQALISDLLEFKLNRVTVDIADKTGNNTPKKKTYDLNTQADVFLQQYAAAPFPEAVDANEKELAEVSQREQSIRSRPDLMNALANAGNNTANNNLEGKNKDLSEAIESLPEILQKKANLEAHTNVMQALMKHIASREIPTFFELEQSILTAGGRITDRAAVLTLLRDSTKGTMGDKARLLAIIASMQASDPANATKAAVEEFDAAFTQGCQGISPTPPSAEEIAKVLAGIAFLRRLISLQSSPMSRLSYGSSSTGGLSSLLNTASSRATSLIAKAASFFTKFTPYYATRVVHALAEGRGGPEEESFAYFDPRARDGDVATRPPTGHKYSDVIVFVLGGGCYAEYYNLQELLKDKASSGGSLRNIMYGCTDLVSGDDFLDELERLAK